MNQHVNLMSASSLRRQTVRDAVRGWSRILAALLLVLLLVGAVQWHEHDRAARRLAAAELQCQPVREMRSQNSRMQQEIDTLRQRDHVLLALARQRSLLSLVGWTSRSVRERAGAVYLEQLEFQQNPLAASAGQPHTANLALAGSSRDPESVRQLVAALRRDGPFRSVDVQMDQSHSADELVRQDFSIECEL